MKEALSVNDILKKLNKDKSEEDKIKKVSEQPKDYLTRLPLSTGSPYLDILTGGYAKGGFNIIIADGGTGKSTFALTAAKKEAETTGKSTVYFDAEGTLNDSYIERVGINKANLIIVRGRNLENMLDTAEALSMADDIGLIIMDSIPIFVSSVVEAKSAAENNMAVEARKFTARMPIIEGNCSKRNIGIIGLTSYKLDPSAMGDPRKLSRGLWQYTMANTIIELTKKDIITDAQKNAIGHKIDVRVKKSKFTSYNAKDAYSINFYYDGVFNEIDEYARIFTEKGIAVAGGAWIKFPDANSEEISVNGMDKFITHLKENREDFETLLKHLKDGR